MEPELVIEASKIIIPAVVGFGVASLQRISRNRKKLYDLLQQNSEDVSRLLRVQERWGQQFRVLFIVQNKQIQAQRATLEVVSKQSDNGNVVSALQALNEAEAAMHNHSTIGWGCPPST